MRTKDVKRKNLTPPPSKKKTSSNSKINIFELVEKISKSKKISMFDFGLWNFFHLEKFFSILIFHQTLKFFSTWKYLVMRSTNFVFMPTWVDLRIDYEDSQLWRNQFEFSMRHLAVQSLLQFLYFSSSVSSTNSKIRSSSSYGMDFNEFHYSISKGFSFINPIKIFGSRVFFLYFTKMIKFQREFATFISYE